MDFTKEISAFVNAKISEEIAKSKVLSLKILENSNILTLGTALSGSYAKLYYGNKTNTNRRLSTSYRFV